MRINKLYPYPKLDRITADDGVRHYKCPVTHLMLPSVTTILDATKDKTALKEWAEAVGEKKASRAKEEGLALGTLVHTHIENHIMGIPRPRGNNLIRMQAERMATQIIEKALPKVDEVWGQEVAMYMPGIYAGTTDLVGIYEGVPAIMDHKNAKKMRSRDMIEDYFCQLAAYTMAHNEVYGTDIKKGVIFMVDRELNFQEFLLEGLEMERFKVQFLTRLEDYMQTASAPPADIVAG